MIRALRTGATLVLFPLLAGGLATGSAAAQPAIAAQPSASAQPFAAMQPFASVLPSASVTAGAARVASVPVTRVVDGDTLTVRIGSRTEKVRIIGVDTPEVGECYAAEATRRLTALIGTRHVRLVADKTQPDRDRYKRLLRHVVLPDGKSAAPLLIAGGFGWEFMYGKPYAGRATFVKAEAQAIKAKSGLWRGCPAMSRTISLPTQKCAIKGNISKSDERIYHLPGQRHYLDTVITPRKGERYFCTELQARKAGWRKSKL